MTRRSSRWWIFRALAVLLSLLPFVLLEGICVLCDWGTPESQDDPFVGFAAIHPLFELNAAGSHYEIALSRRSFFAHDQFPVTKGRTTKRAFCLGGSTVQGNPYSIETSFTTWLRLALQEADPEHDWEVVNCGGISYASYRLVPILDEVLGYEPDLIVICSGHNEFLEDRSYQQTKQLPDWSHVPLEWLFRRRTVVLGSSLLQRALPSSVTVQSDAAALLPAEVDAMLDYNNGLAVYHRDLEWRSGIIKHYGINLRRMVARCQQAGVPLLMMQPTSNLSGSPPFKSEHTAGISLADLDAWQSEKSKGIVLSGTHLPEAILAYQRAVVLNPEHASTWYELGRLQELTGELTGARESLIRARDLDICPLRMVSELEVVLQQVAREESVPCLDLQTMFESKTPTGILGDVWLVDHVHPSFAGHQQIALAMVEEFERQNWIAPPPTGWQTRAQRRFGNHFASLDRPYFHRGQRHLQSLRGWSQGRASGPAVESRFPHRLLDSKSGPVND